MSWRANGGYLGPRPTGPSASVASGWWDSRSQFRNRRDSLWPSNGDPFWNDVVLLLKMDGSNGSTTFTDSSASSYSVTAFGNAQISTAQAKFGQSGSFDGTGDYLSLPSNSALDMAGNFTWEWWMYLNNNANGAHFVAKQSVDTTIQLTGVNNSTLLIFDGGNRSVGAIATGQWIHFALVRSSGVLQAYLNGTATGSSWTNTSATRFSLSSARIGARWTDAFFLNGYLDEFRATKAARYTSNFTPSDAPFPTTL